MRCLTKQDHLIRLLAMSRLSQRARKRSRKYYVRPLHQNRPVDGIFARQLLPMRVLDTEWHKTWYRMSRDSFDELLELVRGKIEKKPTHRHPISAEERLALTLR